MEHVDALGVVPWPVLRTQYLVLLGKLMIESHKAVKVVVLGVVP